MAANPAAALREGPRSFSVLVRDACNGAIEKAASEILQKLLLALEEEAMVRSKAKGYLMVKIVVEVDKHGNGALSFNVDKKEPIKLQSGGPIWLTPGSNYSLDPPGRDNRIRDVSAPSRGSIDDEDGEVLDDEEIDHAAVAIKNASKAKRAGRTV
jgi:hypothetical protein